MLTLGDLLDHRPFGLELHTGDGSARDVPVQGAHSIDLPDAVQWLQERWVMLTTGVQFRGDDDAQRRLVRDLADGGIAALGLGLGIALETPPAALAEEARRRGLPLLTVPLATPFRDIVSFVARASASADLGALRRLAAMEHLLLDALHEREPERVVVERLAGLLDGADAAYLDLAGRVTTTTAPGVAWDAVGGEAISVPVLRGTAPIGRLAVLLGRDARPVERTVVRTAAELLALVAVTRDQAGRERSARRRRLGLRVVRVAQGAADPGLAAELAAEGLDFTRPCRVALVAGARLDALEAALGADHVLAAAGDHALVVLQGEMASLDGLRIGVSDPVTSPDGIAAGVRQARLALAVALGGEEPVREHAGLDPAVALLGEASPAARARLRDTLAALDGQPRLRAAVDAYLDAGLNLGRAAASLGLHRNSLRYRLDRAEEILGARLSDVGTVATLYLAVLSERLDGGLDPKKARTSDEPAPYGAATAEPYPVS